MKKILSFSAVVATALMIASCSCGGDTYNKGDRMPQTTQGDIDTVSYALGMYFGQMIKASPFGEINLSELRKGFNEMLNGEETALTEQEIGMIIQKYLRERHTYTVEKAKQDGQDFLEANKAKEGVVVSESGLQYKIVREGSGVAPTSQDTVEVNYEGRLIDGTVFDSSYERGETAKFPLTAVIKGWTEGITYAKEGGEIELYIPSELAYGVRGSGPVPGNSTLIFKVELIKVMPYNEEAEAAKKLAKEKAGKPVIKKPSSK